MSASDHSNFVNRDGYPLIKEIVTRWSDYDMLRHVNNVQYYRFFEFIILDNLADLGMDWITDPEIPFVVESNCHFRKPLPRARTIEGGIRVAHMGRSSVRYEMALFEKGASTASAYGYFTHVYIERESEQSVPVPDVIRTGLEKIQLTA